MRHCGFDPQAESAVTMTHRRTGETIGADWHPAEEDLPFSFGQVEGRINSGWAAERAARAEAFASEKRNQVARRSSAKSPVRSSRKTKRKKA
jgi:hypothetical protein